MRVTKSVRTVTSLLVIFIRVPFPFLNVPLALLITLMTAGVKLRVILMVSLNIEIFLSHSELQLSSIPVEFARAGGEEGGGGISFLSHANF